MEENVASLFGQVSRLLRRSFDARARELGVTRPQWQVLSILQANAAINQGALADLLEVEPITVGRMIDRMQESGLVERRADPADRRAWHLFITDKGERLYADLLPSAQETVDQALAGLDRSQRDSLLVMLNQMRSNLGRRIGAPEMAGHG